MMSRKFLWVALGVLFFFVVLFWLYKSGWWFTIPYFIRKTGAFGIFVSYFLVLLQTVIPFIPFAMLAGFNSTVHGYWIGFLCTFAGAFSGSVILYYVSANVLHRYLSKWLTRWMKKHPAWAKRRKAMGQRRGWSIFVPLLLLRIQPWLPASIIDITAGLSRVNLSPYLAATILAQGPMIALESYVGHRVLNVSSHQQEVWWIAGVSMVSLIIYGIFIFLRKRHQKHRTSP